MNFLLINGSPHRSGNTKAALSLIKGRLSALGDAADIYDIGPEARQACTGCGACKGGGACVIGDTKELAAAISAADGIVIATPTYYANACGSLTALLSRLIRSEKAAFFKKPCAAVATGRRAGVCEAAGEIYKFFEFTASPIVTASYPMGIFSARNPDTEGERYLTELADNMHAVAACLTGKYR